MFEAKDQESIIHAMLCSKQWTSGDNEQNPTLYVKENARKSQRKVGGWTAWSSVGLRDNL